MPVAWEDFELAEPIQDTTDWSEFEPVEIPKPKRDEAKIAALRAQQKAAARTGTLANIAGDVTDFLTGGATGLTFSPSAIVGQIERGIGLNLGLEQTMRTPIVKVPEIPTTKETPVLGQLGAGAANAVIELANFFLSPEGVAMLGTGKLPVPLRKTVTASWAGQLLANSPQRFDAALEAAKKGDVANATKEVVAGLGQTAMAGALGRATAGEIKLPKVPTFDENLQALAERKALAGTMPARVISPAVTGPMEAQMWVPPTRIEPPSGMVFEQGPFRRILPFEMYMMPESARALAETGVEVPLAPKLQRETRGKVSFGAEAPVLTRTALGPKEEPVPEPSAPAAPVPTEPTTPPVEAATIAPKTEAAAGAQNPLAPIAEPSKVVDRIGDYEIRERFIQADDNDPYKGVVKVAEVYHIPTGNKVGMYDNREVAKQVVFNEGLEDILWKEQQVKKQQPAAPAAQAGTGGPNAIEKRTEPEGRKPEYPRTDEQRQAAEAGGGNRPVGSGTEPQAEQAAPKGPLLLEQGQKRRKTLKEIREQENLSGQAGFINISVLGDAIDRLRDQISILNAQGKVKAAFTWAKDAAMNKADQYADVIGNTMNNMLQRAAKGTILPTRKETITGILKPWKKPDELYRTALTVGVESLSDMPAGHPEHGIVGRDRLILQQARLDAYNPPNGTMAKWKAKALAGLDYAINNWARLEPTIRRYQAEMRIEAQSEIQHGIDTLIRNGYVLHETDLEGVSPFDFLKGKVGTERAQFTKNRVYPTYVDKIIANSKPITMDAIALAKRRLQVGQRKINNKAWVEGLRNTIDTTSGNPIITQPKIETRADGSTYPVAPTPDYSLVQMGYQTFAIHKGYEGAFEALNNPSRFTANMMLRGAMKTAGTTKHLVLMMDTFHLGRLALWASILQKRPVGYRKGLVLLRYSIPEITEMARRGEIPTEYLADLVENKRQIGLALKHGFNVSKIQDALWQDWVQNIPVAGAFNKWLFGEFQQGAMMQAWLIEFARQKKAYDWMSESDVARKVSRELNARFGNLQNQGIFRSKTKQDLARLLFLAPQWNEGLIRSEIGAIAGLGKTGWNAATKKKLAVSALTRSTGILFLAQFAANQLLNYITRGHSTMENPEDGLDSKISAYIPDVIGGGPGMFLSPVALPAETAHLLYKRFERSKDFDEALRQYGRTRLGTVTRPISIWVTQKDAFGRAIKSADLWKEIGTSALPIPISGGAAYHAARQAITGEKTEQFPGQFQKQAMASVGVKTESVPTATQQTQRLAMEWNKERGDTKTGEYYKSDYTDLDRFLQIGNIVDAKKQLQEVRKKHKDDAILKRYEQLPTRLFTHSSEADEMKFFTSLTPEQKKTYLAARRERVDLLKQFYQLWAGRGPSGYKEQ